MTQDKQRTWIGPVLTCEHCGTNMTVPAPLRDYCSACNPIFGKSTTISFDDLVAQTPMPEPKITHGFARYEMGEDGECWGWRLYTAEEPGSEPMVVGKVPGMCKAWAPTHEAMMDGLRKLWRRKLHRSCNPVLLRSRSNAARQTGRLSSEQPNVGGRPQALEGPITKHRRGNIPPSLRAEPTTDAELFAFFSLIVDALNRWHDRPGVLTAWRDLVRWAGDPLSHSSDSLGKTTETVYPALQRIFDGCMEHYGKTAVRDRLQETWRTILRRVQSGDLVVLIRAVRTVLGAQGPSSAAVLLSRALHVVTPHVPILSDTSDDGRLNALMAHPLFVLGLLSAHQGRDWIEAFSIHK